jgi:hypothetical protein
MDFLFWTNGSGCRIILQNVNAKTTRNHFLRMS